ncbi:MAG: heptosyltransferase-3 [Flavobacteriaceae bacterium]
MKTVDLSNKRVIISRTDSIGDVMLTLPLCAWIKAKFPSATLIFLGKGYTRAVVEAYELVDQFEDWADYADLSKPVQLDWMSSLNADVIVHVFPNKELASLCKKTKISVRVGTSHRSYHLLTCTHRPNFTRKRSELHEAQLNHELLRPFGLTIIPSLEEIIASTTSFVASETELPAQIEKAIINGSKCIVLHPKSQGSAKEWPMEKYLELTEELLAKGHTVFYTGTESEGAQFRERLPTHERLMDTTGKLTLLELIYFISRVDYLLACSTGPLHIAGYLGVNTLGFYAPKRPIHPGRWKALGPNVTILVNDAACEKCAKKGECDCIQQISVATVLNEIA